MSVVFGSGCVTRPAHELACFVENDYRLYLSVSRLGGSAATFIGRESYLRYVCSRGVSIYFQALKAYDESSNGEFLKSYGIYAVSRRVIHDFVNWMLRTIDVVENGHYTSSVQTTRGKK